VTAILPGATIGILGGGQLGRMTAMAARSLGYRIQVMDPDPSCPARFVVDACFEGGWDDARVAADLARGCDVVTLEIEQVSIACLEAAAKYAPVRPGAGPMRIIQDRILQKKWLAEHGAPLGAWRAAESEAELVEAVAALGGKPVHHMPQEIALPGLRTSAMPANICSKLDRSRSRCFMPAAVIW